MLIMESNWTACRAGGLLWGIELDDGVPPLRDPEAREAEQRRRIAALVRNQSLVVFNEGNRTACPKVIAIAREEHRKMHPSWPALKVLMSINVWGVWNRPAATVEYWPFQVGSVATDTSPRRDGIRDLCDRNDWWLKINGSPVQFVAKWGAMKLFDVRIPEFRRAFASLALETFRPRTVNGLATTPNDPDMLFLDETNQTGTQIHTYNMHLPTGWSEGATIFARLLTGGMFNGSLGDTPMMRGRFIQNAHTLTLKKLKGMIDPYFRPARDNVIHFVGDPDDESTLRRAAAIASIFGDAHWQVEEGRFDSPVNVESDSDLVGGRIGLPSEYQSGFSRPLIGEDHRPDGTVDYARSFVRGGARVAVAENDLLSRAYGGIAATIA